jgi:uncharacterized RDD family membrane protein YckC
MTAPADADAGLPEPVPSRVGVSRPAPLGDSLQPYLPLSAEETENLRGQHAGFASRFIAFIVDCAVSIGVFMLVLGAASFAASVLTGSSIHWSRANTWVVVAFFAWEFLYYAYFWTASGKTPGMVLLGVQVVGQDGSSVGTKRGLRRTGWASSASCWGVIAARCTTSSPALQSYTAGTRAKRGFGPSPVRAAAGSPEVAVVSFMYVYQRPSPSDTGL